MEPLDPEQWKIAWRAAGYRRRYRVKHAVQRGLAVGGPDDAQLALGLIRRWDQWWYVPWLAGAALFGAAWTLDRYVGGPSAGGLLSIWLAVVIGFQPFAPGSGKRGQARLRNEAVLGGFNDYAVNEADLEQLAAWRQRGV